jgi:histidine triad (HIT) family protein
MSDATYDSGCIFCSIVAGDAPASRIDEDERTLAFMDINPATWGHALVIPKAHAVDLLDLSADDLAACSATAQRIARRASEALGADGVNLLQCTGADAWQTVFHFHLHVVPRYADDPSRDSLQLPWIPSPGDPDVIAAAAARLRQP